MGGAVAGKYLPRVQRAVGGLVENEGRIAHALVRGLADSGHDVTLFASGSSDPAPGVVAPGRSGKVGSWSGMGMKPSSPVRIFGF